MPILKKIPSFLSQISVFCGKAVSWLTVAMVLLLAGNVLSSWLFNQSSILASELVTWMHSANFLLAAAYTLNRNEHVRVDIFYTKMSETRKAWVDLLGTLLLLIPTSLFILWSSWSYVAQSYKFAEVSVESGGMPAIFIFKGFLVLMPVLLIFEGIYQIQINLQKLINSEAGPQAGGSKS